MRIAVSFTNFGPYHLARLRALAIAAHRLGGEVIAYETAGSERLYPWRRRQIAEPFRWVTLHPDKALEDITPVDCALSIEEALERDQPTCVAVAGYARPETMAAARWARRSRLPAILMSESQEVDRPRSWWKEAIKRRRVSNFSAALVGGRTHAEYLIRLGMRPELIHLGYNAVDNLAYSARAQAARRTRPCEVSLPDGPYFLSVSRFAPEKNLERLVGAYARYRRTASGVPWHLVLCGGGPSEKHLSGVINESGYASSIHRPGFLQAEQLAPWYAHASAFVLASSSEPWGLVVNEAAACGLPLLVSERAGATCTLVVGDDRPSGRSFDPSDEEELASSLAWMADLEPGARAAMGLRAQEIVSEWGPERFARGLLDAIESSSAGSPRLPLARAS